MKVVTVCFLLRGEEEREEEKVCLAPKLRTYGVGKLCGYGGNFKKGETDRDCAARETLEECGVSIEKQDLLKRAIVTIYLGHVAQFEIHAFAVRKWSGEPRKSEEMGEPVWFPTTRLPYEKMFPDAPLWMVRAIKVETFEADIYLTKDGSNVERYSSRKAAFD